MWNPARPSAPWLRALAVLWLALPAAPCAGAGPPDGEDWPHYRGPNRSGIVESPSGWRGDTWPVGEPLWSVEIGQGSTSPTVVGGRVYVMGWRDGRDRLVCLDLARGSVLWEVSYPCPRYGRHATGDQGLYSGVTSTPEFDPATGLVYTLSIDGHLNCWSTRDRGRNVWGLNLYDRYGMTRRPKIGRSGRRDYGYTSSPLVHGETLVVEVGSPQGCLMGFDKRTGRRLWVSECRDPAGHTAGPVPITLQGVPCATVLTLHHLLVVRLDAGHEGETVGTVEWETEFANNIASPAVHGNSVLVTSGYNQTAIARFRASLRGLEELWRKPYCSKVATPVVAEGRVWWAWRKVHCLDFESGELLGTGGRHTGDAGSCILTGDGRLIVWAHRGDLLLVEARGSRGEIGKELAHRSYRRRDDVWPHAVLAGSRLLLKDRWGRIDCLPLGQAAEAVALDREVPTMKPDGTAQDEPRGTESHDPVPVPSAPGKGLLLGWKRGFESDRLFGPRGAPEAGWRLQARGDGKLDETGRIHVERGAMVLRGPEEAVLKGCRQRGELAIEIAFAPTEARQTGPARIFSFSEDPHHRNFTLGQEEDRLVFRLRTTRTGENGMNPQTVFGRVRQGRTHHLVLTYRPGRLAAYLDGKRVCDSTDVEGDLSNWTPQHLLVGDEWRDSRHWRGTVEWLALYCRWMDEQEAEKRWQAFRKHAAGASEPR